MQDDKIYKTVSEYCWGCIPADKDWAINTGIYKEMLSSLIERSIIPPK